MTKTVGKKRILITGVEGFIGNHLWNILETNENFELYGIDKKPSVKKNFYQLDLSQSGIEEILNLASPHIIFHLAAQTDVRLSLNDIKLDYENNYIATKRICDGIRDTKTHIIFSNSGGAIFGETNKFGANELSKCAPLSPYGEHKLMAQKYIESLTEKKQFNATILNLSNVYGLEPISKSAPSIFVEKSLRNEKIIVNGDGTSIRDWIFISDVLDVMLQIIHKPFFGTLNISSGRGTSINELLAMISSILEKTLDINHTLPIEGEVICSVLNNSQLRNLLPNLDFTSLDSGIKQIITYLRSKC